MAVVKAILMPFGDHVGAHSLAGLVVSRSIPKPEGEMEYRLGRNADYPDCSEAMR